MKQKDILSFYKLVCWSQNVTHVQSGAFKIVGFFYWQSKTRQNSM